MKKTLLFIFLLIFSFCPFGLTYAANECLDHFKMKVDIEVEIKLGNCHLTDQDIPRLITLIKKDLPNDYYYLILDLRNNQIGFEGFSSLLNTLHSLYILDLENNHIGDEGAILLADQKNNPLLDHINLNNNQISDKGANALAKLHPRFLYLANNHLTNDSVKKILTAKNLFLIELSHNDHIDDETARAIANNTSLKTILIADNQITAKGAFALADREAKIDELDISGNPIGADGIGAILTKQPITSLNISNTHIGPEIASALAQADVINLNISHNPIGSVGVAATVSLGLDSLNIADTNVDKSGLLALTKIKTPHSWSLDISQNKLRDDDMALIAKSHSINQLIANDNQITSTGIKTLIDMPQLESLSLKSNKIDDKGATLLASKNNLKKLELDNNLITAASVETLSDSNIEYLSLNNNELGNKGAGKLGTIKSLRYLYLHHCGIGDDDALALIATKRYLYLDVSQNHIGKVGIEALQNLFDPDYRINIDDNDGK